jgi:hypothetical protein
VSKLYFADAVIISSCLKLSELVSELRQWYELIDVLREMLR